jgi:hypothetical protein
VRDTWFGPRLGSGWHIGGLAEESSCELLTRESEGWRVFTMAVVSVREINLLDGSSLPSRARVWGWGRDEVACVCGCQREEAGTRLHRYAQRDRAVTLKNTLGNAVRQCYEVAGALEARARLPAAQERWTWGIGLHEMRGGRVVGVTRSGIVDASLPVGDAGRKNRREVLAPESNEVALQVERGGVVRG